MADNVTTQTTVATVPSGTIVATDQVTYSGDANAHIAPVSLVVIAGAEGSKTATSVPSGGGVESAALRVTLASDSTGLVSVDDNGGSLTVDGTVAATQSGTWNVTNVSGTVSLPTGASTLAEQQTQTTALQLLDNIVRTEDEASADGHSGAVVLFRRTATPANTSGADLDYEVPQMSAGRVWVSATVDAALPAGTNAIGKLAANSGVDIGDVDVLTLPNVTLAAGTNTNEVVGDAAHDAAVAGNPIRVAGRAINAEYTAVATGDTADVVTTLTGKLITQPFATPALTWSYAAASGGIVNTTGVTAKAAAGAGVRNYVSRCQAINGHATVSTDVQIRDGASGTVLWRGFAQAAGGGVACDFDPPLRGTANTLIEVACGTTGTATYFNLQGYVSSD